MIVVRLTGGLGNQLFQYAAGRALALRHGTKLGFDISSFRTDTQRRFRLDQLPVSGAVLTEQQITRLLRNSPENQRPGWRHRLFRLGWRVVGVAKTEVYRQHDLSWEPAVVTAGPNCYLDGYWQSEDYFADHADLIRNELTPPEPVSDLSQSWVQRIKESESVCVHVRRGDYLSNEAEYRVHGVCQQSYYEVAIGEVSKRIADPRLFVFSDDPEWCRSHARLRERWTVVSGSGMDEITELWLMAQCRHHIIANSSYSWWGAWLSQKVDGVKVAPKQWFAVTSRDTTHLIPSRWIQI